MNIGSHKHVTEAWRMQKKSQTQWWFDPPLHAIYRHAPEEPHFVIAAASKKDQQWVCRTSYQSILYIHEFIDFKSSNQIKLGRAITYSIRTNFKLSRYVIFTVFEGDLLSAKFSSLKLIDWHLTQRNKQRLEWSLFAVPIA